MESAWTFSQHRLRESAWTFFRNGFESAWTFSRNGLVVKNQLRLFLKTDLWNQLGLFSKRTHRIGLDFLLKQTRISLDFFSKWTCESAWTFLNEL
ncbi:6307_t:CDS:2, partial [Funneliformis caledonium]